MASKKSKKKIGIIAGIVLLVILIIVVILVKNQRNEGIKVTAEKVAKRSIIQTVSANGKIQPEKDIKISPYISGEKFNRKKISRSALIFLGKLLNLW